MQLTVDELTSATVRFIESLARGVERLSTWLVYFVAIPAVINIVLAAALMDGGVRIVVLVFLVLVGGIGLLAALTARWRFRAVTTRAPQLANELHQLISTDASARQAIDTYIVDDENGERFVADLPAASATPQRASRRRPGIIRSTRNIIRVRRFVGDNMDRFTTVTAAVSAAKVGPWLVLVATGAAIYLSLWAMTFLTAAMLRLIAIG